MTESAPDLSREDVPARSRLYGIDLLRGVAVLGILLMNIGAFSMPLSAYSYPWSWGDMTGANAGVYFFGKVVADGKFITLFALLFGAGVILQQSKPLSPELATRLHFRRMFGLLAIGMAHAYFIWYGDILFTYALLGMLIFLLRNAPGKVLVPLAIVLFVCGIVFNAGLGLLLHRFFPDSASEFSPSLDDQLKEIDAYRDGWVSQLSQRIPVALLSQTYLLLTFCVPLVTPVMLIGMVLLRSGFFHLAWKRRTYVLIAAVGIPLGWTLTGVGLWLDARSGRHPILSVMVWHYFNILGTVPAALGYAALVLMLANGKFGPRLWPLAAVGKTALSCYLLQSILCTLLFYGHGFGLFGRVERAGQFAIVIGIWVVLIVFASVWTSRFRFGPAEWFWRGLTYGFGAVKTGPATRHT